MKQNNNDNENKNKKALDQLDNIHNILMEKENIIPYGSSSLLLWTIVSAVLFLGFEHISNISIMYAMVLILSISFSALILGIYDNIKENKKYELFNFTNSQKFIHINQILFISIAILLSYVFVSNDIGYYCYPTWVFLIGFLTLNIGFISNSNQFKITSIINIFVSIIMFIMLIGGFFEVFLFYLSYISTLVCSGSLLYLSIITKK